MKFKPLFALALSFAVSMMPLAAAAHEGHHHPKTDKKVKKTMKTDKKVKKTIKQPQR